jgi:predicted dienelactone hydrolase
MKALGLALVLIACGGKAVNDATTDLDAGFVWSPADDVGPFKAGTVASSFIGRTGVELNVQVWYPSSSDSDMLHQYDGFMAWDAIDAPEPDCADIRPVLAFSHGNQGMRWQSPFLVEFLASHGFVVVAPDHTGNTTFDYDATRMSELIFRRPLDVSDAADWLFEVAPEEIPGLGDCLDPSAGFAVSGHSFGGYTVTALGGARFDHAAIEDYCASAGGWLCDEYAVRMEENPDDVGDYSDPRVWAAIPLAPAGFELLGGGAGEATIPFLVLGGEYDSSTSMATQVGPIYDALGSEDKTLGTLLRGGHMIFSSACDMAQMAECEGAYLDDDVGHPAIATAVTAWLQMQLGHEGGEEAFPYTSELWTWEQP